MVSVELYDVIIVGGGAAGLTAAIYAGRKNMKSLLITVEIGGQTNLTPHIENYPGYTAKSGPELMKTMEQQARSFGAEFIFGKVTRAEKDGKNFSVTTSSGDKYASRTLILANGKVPKTPGIPGEEKFMGRGISTCAVCDAPIFKNKTVAVIGGGNSALDAAELASKFSSKVYLVHRRNEFRGDEMLVNRVKKIKNIEFILNHVPVEVVGDKFVKSLVTADAATKERKELKVDGIFVEIGYIVDTEFVRGLVRLNSTNEIIVDNLCRASRPGIFAAGDITDTPYKQTVVAAGSGATAALSAYNYLQKSEGGQAIRSDW
ncbi:MAG: thioredoxin-disulfide reductase [Candidatus Aenigmatarchaeota archaeon]